MLEINFGLICFIYRTYMSQKVFYITYTFIIYCVCTYDTLLTCIYIEYFPLPNQSSILLKVSKVET